MTTDFDRPAPPDATPAPWRVPTRVVRRPQPGDNTPSTAVPADAAERSVSPLDPCFQRAGELIDRTPVYPQPPQVDWATGRPLDHVSAPHDISSPSSLAPVGNALPPPTSPSVATPVPPGRSPVPPPPPAPPGVSGAPLTSSALTGVHSGVPAVTDPTDPQLAHLLGRMGDDVVAGVEAMKSVSAPVDPNNITRPIGERAAEFEVGAGLAFQATSASLGARAAAWLIDVASIGVITAPGWYLVTQYDGVIRSVGIAVVVLGVIVAARSYTRAVASSGSWIGNRVTQTGVVDARNGQLLTTGAAATRFVLRFSVSLVFFFGYLPALAGGQRRTFHDSFAGSVVVGRARQTWQLGDARDP